MLLVREDELLKINGGAIRWGVIVGIGAFASFIIGVFDGWVNPRKCNR